MQKAGRGGEGDRKAAGVEEIIRMDPKASGALVGPQQRGRLETLPHREMVIITEHPTRHHREDYMSGHLESPQD